MASKSFQERFKNKISSVSQDGRFDINPERTVSVPFQSQLHSSVLKSSANFMISPGFNSPIPKSHLHTSDNSFYASPSVAYTEPVSVLHKSDSREKDLKEAKRSYNLSAAPLHVKNEPTILSKEYQKFSDFKPYTLKDYHIIKPKSYYELGGLGPANVGTTDWLKKKEINDKRLKYGKEIYFYNAAKLPMFPAVGPIKPTHSEENTRQRALAFAKKISRPSLKY